jgi:ribonuclease Z
MNLWFLGTGAGRPNKHRNVTSVALQLPSDAGWWLFDAGEATQHQLMKIPQLKLNRLSAVFITHLHGDHLYGLPGLLSSRSFDGGITPLKLIGPAGIRTYIETVFGLTGTSLDYELAIEELSGLPAEVHVDGPLSVEAGMLEHRIPCYGYRVSERDAPGPLLADKLPALGLKAGPSYGLLKQGCPVETEDGTVIRPEDVTDGVYKGRIVTILGDTSPCREAVRLAKDADVLVHEATFAAGLEDKAHEFGHSTTVEAARAAADAGARRLVMTHFSGRYDNEALLRLEAEARTVFAAATAAADLLRIDIERKHIPAAAGTIGEDR